MFGQKERRTLVGLAAGLIRSNPKSRKEWQEALEFHELMKNDRHYVDGYGGDVNQMELQLALMREILQAEKATR